MVQKYFLTKWNNFKRQIQKLIMGTLAKRPQQDWCVYEFTAFASRSYEYSSSFQCCILALLAGLQKVHAAKKSATYPPPQILEK